MLTMKEAKEKLRIAYNNNEISKENYQAYKRVVSIYESRLKRYEDTQLPWTISDERLLVKLYNKNASINDMVENLGRSTRAIEKRLANLKALNIIE